MQLHELYPTQPERKNRKRIGRGSGSGWGKTAGKGHKGQNARSGGGVRPGFEGGQMPLARRLPKRGFKNPFRQAYGAVNLDTLVAVFEGQNEITVEEIYAKGLCPKSLPVKVLGRVAEDGFKAKLTVEAHRFSQSAREMIEKAGGTVKALEG
jgi:large subunit ribosomal protein L15